MSTALSEELADEAATLALAARLALALKPPLLIALEGNLGAGKTTLARGVIQTLAPGTRVKSPTYTLVESYPVPFGAIHHFDLYRLVDPDELEQIDLAGFADANAVLLIEWPDKGGERTAYPDLRVQLAYDGAGRTAQVHALSQSGQRVLDALSANGPVS
ncbi:tRNA (adenosine(37)-N6)-threonylcarbamoyltransferase complex ATPase subunit type 1 TsaE [Ahniella affigens]|uniref:tRNA threonylcarbamoyladenosine biosynthesis protein TsaE n=1 Tax=Ahniella affigens TaxID=2021234 RepID=A0A2P1PS70_9GAMM|nr:tRNA (adenosine(37)-N6)-threonylcarbamoyltransferase complex ATPase subunit type 1 TsaE [Ahniella affigens]AVP97672.1 tRNA (adenosine(37)-N6)-threonylcarbamoyltransferase complex ATPase subunit type 1 TsaE [Ahniella affigens]